MERESFIFYKSFYEATAGLTKDIKLEVLTAIIEYALYGRLPENLKPFARGMFTLVKPNIDVNNTRFENGKKGGRKPKKKSAPANPAYTLTYDQEVDAMRADEQWRQTICRDFDISQEEYEARLTRFLIRCHEDGKKKGRSGHDNADDAHSHFRYWMSKAYHPSSDPAPQKQDDIIPPSDYSFTGGFGGIDM